MSARRHPVTPATPAVRPMHAVCRAEPLEARTLMAVSTDGVTPGDLTLPLPPDSVRPVFVSPGAAVAGRVFDDPNGDGLRGRGERGLAGRAVFLDANGNGAADAGEPATTTKASGRFTFRRVPAGTYDVRLADGAGWRVTTPQEPVTVGAFGRQRITAADIGVALAPPPEGAVPVSGTVYVDVNGNGSADRGEGLPRRIRLMPTAGGASYATQSDLRGRYLFPAVQPGTYVLHDTMPKGFDGNAGTTLRLDYLTIEPGGGPVTWDVHPQTTSW